MKYLPIFLFYFLASISLFAAGEEIGIIETFEGGVIRMYKRSEVKKIDLSILGKNCDCTNESLKFYYFNEAGDIKKIPGRRIKLATLKKGTVYCKTISNSSSMEYSSFNSIRWNAALKEDAEMMALPTRKGSVALTLQMILAKTDEYILSFYSYDSGGNYVVISGQESRKSLASALYVSVGVNKKGKSFLESLKNYFKDCDDLIEIIEKNEKTNLAALKRRDKVPFLKNVMFINCDTE